MGFVKDTLAHMTKSTGYVQSSVEYSILDKAAHTGLIASAIWGCTHNWPLALAASSVIYGVVPKVINTFVRKVYGFHPMDWVSDLIAGSLIGVVAVADRHGPLAALGALSIWTFFMLASYPYAD
jgi:hypothetical protein